MRQKLRNSLLIVISSLVLILGSLSLSINASPAGVLQTSPDENGRFAIASGVYVGNGIVLTTWHVEEPDSSFRTSQQSFRRPQSILSLRIGDRIIPVEDILYLERDLELAVVELESSPLDWLHMSAPCLSTQMVSVGDALTAVSSPYGRYPLVTAALVVSDAEPKLCLDPDPRVSDSDRYAAITIIAIASADQASLVGPGSSGGAVLNSEGQLIGLVWTGQDLEDGSKEVWITPVSEWLTRLQKNGTSEVSEALSKMICTE